MHKLKELCTDDTVITNTPTILLCIQNAIVGVGQDVQNAKRNILVRTYGVCFLNYPICQRSQSIFKLS
jgi:hypothetical protein